MSVVQRIDLAKQSNIGAGGLTKQALEGALLRVEHALTQLRDEAGAGRLPLLDQASRTDDLAEIAATAAALREGASDVVFLGTGGSSLGGQTLCQLAGYGTPVVGRLGPGPRLHFLDNLDPFTFAEALRLLPLATTRFVAISKSGGTGETLMQLIAVISAMKAAGLTEGIGKAIVGLTEPARPSRPNGLRELLGIHGCKVLDHHTGIGGRYSVLTNVGLLPAAIAGLDLAAIRAGAAEVVEAVMAATQPADAPPALGAALNLAGARERDNVTVMMPYSDRLERFTRWWIQLWAESLGKEGMGTQPVGALGPVDQHSQLQLYLGGPRDKLFTVITVETRGQGPAMDGGLAEVAGEPGFGGRTIGDLVAEGRATAETLANNGRPARQISIDRLDERAMGHLLMHFMLETILAGWALEIDPFDQPAVEEGKVLAKRYLCESA
jgi:glucose-6-phosphate isomerase